MSASLILVLVAWAALCKRYSGELCEPSATLRCLAPLAPLVRWHCSRLGVVNVASASISEAPLSGGPRTVLGQDGVVDGLGRLEPSAREEAHVLKFSLAVAGHCQKKDASKSAHVCGEDAFVVHVSPHAPQSGRSFLGVADGVGGWAGSGGDSSLVSRSLLENMRHLSSTTNLSLGEIGKLAFDRMAAQGIHQKGSTTLCALLLDHRSGVAEISNVGDSAAYVIRDGKLLLKTDIGIEGFNTPHQLGFDHYGRPYGSFVRFETKKSFRVRPGDVILLFSDGVIDNLFEHQIIDLVNSLPRPPVGPPRKSGVVASEGPLLDHAQGLVKMAYQKSKDEQWLSPFALSARTYGYHFLGG